MQVQESQDRKPSSDSTYSPFLPPMGVRNIAVNLLVKFLTTSDEAQVEARLIEKDAYAATRMMIRTIYSEEISDRMVDVLKAKNTGASAAGKGALLLPDDGRPKPFVGLIIKNLSSPSSPLTHFGTFSTDEAKALAPFIEQEAFLAVKMKIRKTYNREVCKRVLEIKHKNAAASAAGNIASETEELWCACGNCHPLHSLTRLQRAVLGWFMYNYTDIDSSRLSKSATSEIRSHHRVYYMGQLLAKSNRDCRFGQIWES